MDRPMGAGGMGEVWAAQDQLLDRRVAVKLLHETDENARARFLREARAAARTHQRTPASHERASAPRDLVTGETAG